MKNKLPSYKYKFANNKEVYNHNQILINNFRKENECNVQQISLSSIFLKENVHIKAQKYVTLKHLVCKYIANNKIVFHPMVVYENNNDTYNLVLGYKSYIIANGICQDTVNVIVIDKSRRNLLKSIGCKDGYLVMKLSSLIIPSVFDMTIVKKNKLEKIKEYYYKNHSLDKPITITKDNIIIDGYARYVFARNFELETVECVRINKTYKEVQANA